MPSLRRSSDSEPGIHRRRHGRGFRFVDPSGERVSDPRTIDRITLLAIPPAWSHVWICRSSRGHLQATGYDAAGRKQYLYHQRWREDRDAEKHERILRFAEALPKLRRAVSRDLRRSNIDRTKALATAARILDRTFIRVGSDQYAAQNRTFGLATLRSRHMTIDGDTVVLEFEGKGGKRQMAELQDGRVAQILAEMDKLPGYEVLKYRSVDGTVGDIRASDVNAYVKQHMGEDFTAKDFRTWAGTVAAALALDELGDVGDGRAQRRAIAGVCRTAARLLGNTPAVARASYIDPRVIDHFLDGRTVSHLQQEVERSLRQGHSASELAVLALLRQGLHERERSTAAA